MREECDYAYSRHFADGSLDRLRCNDRAKARWSCYVKVKDEVSSDSLSRKAWHQGLGCGALYQYDLRHVVRSTGWIAGVRKLNIVAQKRPVMPKKTWDTVLVDDRKKLLMDSADPQNRSEWSIGRLRGSLVR